MARVYLSIGSNIGRDENILSCLELLRRHFGALTASTVYESEAVGFEGDDFYNLVVGFDTGDEVHAVARILRAIEHLHGRGRGDARFSSRTLDLDLLLYDDLVSDADGLELPRGDIMRYAFVLKPLAEIAGDVKHPVEGRTMAELWRTFRNGGQGLRPVELREG